MHLRLRSANDYKHRILYVVIYHLFFLYAHVHTYINIYTYLYIYPINDFLLTLAKQSDLFVISIRVLYHKIMVSSSTHLQDVLLSSYQAIH